ncbi:MAG: radical SAM family heme chaperone HemW [Acidimicrobiia bacterium]|nr:radical SAM family heme chaperone HemW [Acidimicrobiia bacterium]
MPFGVYVHIPFCATRCDYCDFATWTDRETLIDAYVDACVADLRRHVVAGTAAPATSVFFGGGTPSLLPSDRLVAILDEIPRSTDAEVTVECNPDSVDADKLAAYRAAGVTRVSFGVQSMRPRVLAALGRTHDPANVTRAVALALDVGFPTFNLDLIYGTPGETVDDWRTTLAETLELEPPHVSAYALTVEPATQLGRNVAAGAPAPDDDDQAEKYEIADELLAAAGLGWYEVSNWARAGHECRHNLLHWSSGDYLPIGCAAHGHRVGHRWWNVRTPERYIAMVEAGDDPTGGGEDLDDATRAEEQLTLAIRTRTGAILPTSMQAEATRLVDAGFLVRAEDRVVLTRRGRLLATDITARLLVAAGAEQELRRSIAGTRYD